MKLIKKIAAIMLSVIMVLGMASVVSAEEKKVEQQLQEQLQLIKQQKVKRIKYTAF